MADMAQKKLASRDRILAAAAEIAQEVGPKHLSLEAVAARAGMSKGGLLYSFPSKSKLLQALIETYVSEFDSSLRKEEIVQEGKPNSCALAFLEVFRKKVQCPEPKPTGILAAIADDPTFIEPIRQYNRELVDRLRANAADPDLVLIAFLAIEGMRSMKLLEADILTPDEHHSVIERLAKALK